MYQRKVKIQKKNVVRIQRILILQKWILKIIKIDNMKKYNKIVFIISFINNFINLKFYNFFVLSSDFGSIQKKKKYYNLLVTLLTFYVNLILK